MARIYTARKNKDGSYMICWGQQIEIKSVRPFSVAKKYCAYRNARIDSKGFSTEDEPLSNDTVLSLFYPI